jgi:hypothetical protein
MSYVDGTARDVLKMYPADFNIIWPRFAALQPTPSIAMHVVFTIGGNPGAWSSWLAATDSVHTAWSNAIASAGLPTTLPKAATGRLGIQWGGFLVVVCAWEFGAKAASLQSDFPRELKRSINATLRPLWTGTRAYH